MIGIDTNVLVRYLIQDDPAQALRATAFLKRLTPAEPGFISVVTLAELAWVLQRSYRYNNQQVSAAVLGLLEANVFVLESEAHVFAALALLEEGKGSLGDALIGQLASKAGCARIVTFDVDATELPGFELI